MKEGHIFGTEEILDTIEDTSYKSIYNLHAHNILFETQ